jgi:hypothetical protein
VSIATCEFDRLDRDRNYSPNPSDNYPVLLRDENWNMPIDECIPLIHDARDCNEYNLNEWLNLDRYRCNAPKTVVAKSLVLFSVISISIDRHHIEYGNCD